MIKAILWDLDGTLVDACEVHYSALNMALKECSNYEISREEHHSTFNGLPTKVKLEKLIERGDIKKEDYSRIWELKQGYTVDAIKNTLNFDEQKYFLHKYLNLLDIREACITNSIRKTAELMLSTTGQLSFMSFTITNEDVFKPKPDPNGFYLAMIRLGCLPSEVLIVEDSDKGMQAALATGAKTLRVSGPNDVNLTNIKNALGLV